jgi:hypothetical protein
MRRNVASSLSATSRANVILPTPGQRPGQDGLWLRSQTIEPVFGQLKTVQGAQRFMRRGLAACEAEWKLLCSTHNLLKLWRHTRRQAETTPIAV